VVVFAEEKNGRTIVVPVDVVTSLEVVEYLVVASVPIVVATDVSVSCQICCVNEKASTLSFVLPVNESPKEGPCSPWLERGNIIPIVNAVLLPAKRVVCATAVVFGMVAV